MFLSLFNTVSFVSQKNIVLSFRMLKAFFLILRPFWYERITENSRGGVGGMVSIGRLIGSLFYLYGRVSLIQNHYQFSQMLGTNVKKNHAHTTFWPPNMLCIAISEFTGNLSYVRCFAKISISVSISIYLYLIIIILPATTKCRN